MAERPKFGLLASIIPEKSTDMRWAESDAVIAYSPEGCQEGETVDPCDPPTIEATDRPAIVEWHAYILRVTERCSTVSGIDDNKARAIRLLEMDTERQLGAEFWEGTLAQASTMPVSGDPWPNTWLANPLDMDILTEAGPVTLTHGLACLEQYLAENNGGQQGAIHATAQVVTHWESFRLLRREGNRILTFKDTVVIPSPGYTGTSPDGDIASGDIWAYATDLPRIFLGPPRADEIMDSIDRLNNTVEMSAFRPGLVEYQKCRHAGVRLDVDICQTGGS